MSLDALKSLVSYATIVSFFFFSHFLIISFEAFINTHVVLMSNHEIHFQEEIGKYNTLYKTKEVNM